MGIRGLGAAVRRYGVFTSLSGDTVVIDGPALIYQILDGCMRQRPASNGFICHPSYLTLGRMVIGWLEELRSHNVNVRKIFFDGYLPPSKWRVRRERLAYQSRTMKDLVTSHPLGSPKLPEAAFETLKAEISLTQSIGHSSYFSWLPKPPFLVPAVIELLRSSHTWGPLVQIVPGEADMFCAEDVRQHGGIVLTGDSDLLIADLGLEGSVSFFGDVVAADRSAKSQGLVASKFSPHAINDRLGLNNVGGLSRVAFEKEKWRSGFDEALDRTKNNGNRDLESPEFHAFMQEHSMTEYLPRDHPTQNIISSLDPRISEIVVQTLLMDSSGAMPDASRAECSRGPETLAMFLPIMIEDRDRKSAWSMSTVIRQIAYGVMQTFARQVSSVVIEYRLLEASNPLMGRQIDVLDPEETLEQCGLLVETLKQLAEQIPRADMQWLAFAIYQDVVWTTSGQRSPLSATLITQIRDRLNDDSDEYSWDLIHFTSQVQASFYSLRMAKQALDVVAFLRQNIPAPMQELRESLRNLPIIAEWPTVETMSQILTTAASSNILAIITDMLGILPIKEPEPLTEPAHLKKRKQKPSLLQDLRNKRAPKRPRSVNPFAVLSHIN
ncbi:hypothetical protein F5Y19DRAFT_381090 [Xylariaceae sp. FL1651]|nr:hypothetical protein F5Y19DRAFT_381090 [Xylariaceae sp. FL1651]